MALSEEPEEKLIAEFHDVRHKKQLGVLLLTSLRAAWAPGEIVQTFQVNYPYKQIKGKAKTKEMIQRNHFCSY